MIFDHPFLFFIIAFLVLFFIRFPSIVASELLKHPINIKRGE